MIRISLLPSRELPAITIWHKLVKSALAKIKTFLKDEVVIFVPVLILSLLGLCIHLIKQRLSLFFFSLLDQVLKVLPSVATRIA